MDYEKYSQASAEQQEKWNRQLALWLAVHLAAVPSYARSRVATLARSLAGSEDVDAPDVWKAIPSTADLHLASGLVTGMGALQAAVMGQPKEAVQPIIEDAQAIAAGTVLHGDPKEGVALPSLAAVVLDSAVRSGEPNLVDPSVAAALFSVAQAYDCAAHTLPLGGGIGSAIKSWWKGLTGSAEEKADYRAQKAAKAEAKAAEKAKAAQTARLEALMKAGFGFDEASKLAATGAASPQQTDDAATTIDQSVIDTGVSPEDALNRFRDALKQSSTTVEAAKEKAEDASAQLARLRWAEAPLNAGKESADLLRDVNPDFSSPSATLQTAFDILLAAKESGSVPKIRLITRLLASSKKKDAGFGSWLTGLLGGDPDYLTTKLQEAAEDGEYAETLDELLREKGALQSVDALAALSPEALEEVGEL